MYTVTGGPGLYVEPSPALSGQRLDALYRALSDARLALVSPVLHAKLDAMQEQLEATLDLFDPEAGVY